MLNSRYHEVLCALHDFGFSAIHNAAVLPVPHLSEAGCSAFILRTSGFQMLFGRGSHFGVVVSEDAISSRPVVLVKKPIASLRRRRHFLCLSLF